MACPCKVVGFGLIGAALLVVAGKSLTKGSEVAAPRSQSLPAQAIAGADLAMRAQSRQIAGGSIQLSAPRHSAGHAYERMAEQARNYIPSSDDVGARYKTFAQRRRDRRSLTGS